MEELDLRELFELFWNKKIKIILITLIFIGIGFGYTMYYVTPKYTSSTTLVLAAEQGENSDSEKASSTTITTTDITLNSKLVSTYSELVKSKNVLRKVIGNLGINSLKEETLKKNISVTAVADTELIKISVSNEDPQVAERVANEIAVVFTEQVKEIYNINNVHVVDEAEVESTPSNINHAKDIVIFAFIGLVLSVGIILLENMLDTTIKSADDIEKCCGIPVLASIPFEKLVSKGGKK